MKYIRFIFLMLTIPVFGQAGNNYESKLKALFKKIDFYDDQKMTNDNAYDSIEKYDQAIEDLLLKYTNTIPSSLTNSFKDLQTGRLNISTSDDGLFRIYAWDDETGGTMRGFRNVMQFKAAGKVKSEAIPIPEDTSDEANYYYEVLDNVISKGKAFYVVKCVAVLSSAISLHKIKIFSIDNAVLNQQAVLIKTKTGIRNELYYEVDLSFHGNQGIDTDIIEGAWIAYDKKNKIITIPLITEEGKITKKKIRYQFKGGYFEKI